YLEVAVVTMQLRGRAKAPRLTELLHRAIPYPMLLVTQLPGEHSDRAVVVSLAHQRGSHNQASAVVVEEIIRTPPLGLGVLPDVEAQFVHSLDIAGLPRSDLFAFYQGWVDRVLALCIAAVTGVFTI